MADLGTRTLVISVGGTDYTAQVGKAVVTSAESDADFTSFADAAAGGARDYNLNLVIKQDLIAATLWDKIFSNAGSTAAVLIKPYGNATATTTQPHFTVSATVTEPDGDLLGTEANKSTTAKATVEVNWPCTKPVRVTA